MSLDETVEAIRRAEWEDRAFYRAIYLAAEQRLAAERMRPMHEANYNDVALNDIRFGTYEEARALCDAFTLWLHDSNLLDLLTKVRPKVLWERYTQQNEHADARYRNNSYTNAEYPEGTWA